MVTRSIVLAEPDGLPFEFFIQEIDKALVRGGFGQPSTHSNISTTKLYDRRHMESEDSPTFRMKYCEALVR